MHPEMVDVPYKSFVGSLVYLVVCTIPSLARTVSALSRLYQNPQILHAEVAKRVLRFVKGTAGEGLGYSPGEYIAIWGYRDYSHGSDADSLACCYG